MNNVLSELAVLSFTLAVCGVAQAGAYQRCEVVQATGGDIPQGHAKPCGYTYYRPFRDAGTVQCSTVSIHIPARERVDQYQRAKGANDWSAWEDQINVVPQHGGGTLVSTTLRNWSESIPTELCLYVDTVPR
jgi:hypothetical protein